MIPTGTASRPPRRPARRSARRRRRSARSSSAGRCCRSPATSSSRRPGAVTPATQAARAPRAPRRRRRCCSSCRRRGRRSTCRPTSSRRAAPSGARLGAARVLPPAAGHPRRPGGATFGAKFLSADLTLTGVFGPVVQGAWVAFWTPWQAGDGQINAAGTVASPAAIAPGGLTLTGRKVRGVKRLAGRVTQAGAGVATRVTILGRGAAHRGSPSSRQRERRVHLRRPEDVEGDDVPGARRSSRAGTPRGLQPVRRARRPVREPDGERLHRDVAERPTLAGRLERWSGRPPGARFH